MGHGEGDALVGDVGVHGGLAGQRHGDAGSAQRGVDAGPAQAFHGGIVAAVDGEAPLPGQLPVAVAGLFRQSLKFGEGDLAVFVPGHLCGQLVGHVPVEFRCSLQLGLGVVHHVQPQIVLDGAGEFVQTVDAGVQQDHGSNCGSRPAKPADDPGLKDEDQNQCGDQSDRQENDGSLPDQKIKGPRPGRQKALHRAGDIRIDHVHQGGILLAHLDQHPGKRAQDGSRQITAPILQGKIPLSES